MIRAVFRIRKQCWCSMQKNRGGKFIRFTVMMIILVQTGGGRSLSGCIVTAENHQVGTGLGSAITNLTSAKNPVPVERIGIQNRFGQVGPQDFLMQQYNLTAEDIVAAALRAIARRQG